MPRGLAIARSPSSIAAALAACTLLMIMEGAPARAQSTPSWVEACPRDDLDVAVDPICEDVGDWSILSHNLIQSFRDGGRSAARTTLARMGSLTGGPVLTLRCQVEIDLPSRQFFASPEASVEIPEFRDLVRELREDQYDLEYRLDGGTSTSVRVPKSGTLSDEDSADLIRAALGAERFDMRISAGGRLFEASFSLGDSARAVGPVADACFLRPPPAQRSPIDQARDGGPMRLYEWMRANRGG